MGCSAAKRNSSARYATWRCPAYLARYTFEAIFGSFGILRIRGVVGGPRDGRGKQVLPSTPRHLLAVDDGSAALPNLPRGPFCAFPSQLQRHSRPLSSFGSTSVRATCSTSLWTSIARSSCISARTQVLARGHCPGGCGPSITIRHRRLALSTPDRMPTQCLKDGGRMSTSSCSIRCVKPTPSIR